MLDQNSDRMWYVIGALVVGAGIILLANKTFPQLFAKTSEAFGGVSNAAIEEINNEFAMHNVLDADGLMLFPTIETSGLYHDYDEETDTWTMEIPRINSPYSVGLKVKPTALRVPYGARFTTRYEVWVPEGIDNAVVNTDINNTFESKEFVSAQNDNDERAGRQFGYYEDGKRVVVSTGNNISASIPIKGGEWTTVWYSYSNTSSTNTNKEALRDYSWIGTTNPTDGPMMIKIRNVYGSIVDENGNFMDENGEVIK